MGKVQHDIFTELDSDFSVATTTPFSAWALATWGCCLRQE